MSRGIDRIRRRIQVDGISRLNSTSSSSMAYDTSRTVNLTNAAMVSFEKFPDELYDEEEIKEYRQLFDFIDTDKSGAIGNEELKEAIFKFGHKATNAEINKIIEEVDKDGNGEIEFDEFCHCMRCSQKLKSASNEEFVRQCFSIFDQDKNGVISQNEFVYIAKQIGGFTDELAELIFRELDVSSNGYLSAEQFIVICADYMLNGQSQTFSE